LPFEVQLKIDACDICAKAGTAQSIAATRVTLADFGVRV
jgi:hypothetical protein